MAPTPPFHPLAPTPAALKNGVSGTLAAAVDIAQTPSQYQWVDDNVTFELRAGEKPRGLNDSSWVFQSSGSRNEGVPDGAFIVDKKCCVGYIRCGCSNDDGTPSRICPLTSTKACQAQCQESCTTCNTRLNLIECPGHAYVLTYHIEDTEGTRVVRKHLNLHGHPRVPVKRLSVAQTDALDELAHTNLNASAVELRVGAGTGQVPLGEIAPVMHSAAKARAEVEKSQARLGIGTKSQASLTFGLLDAFRKVKFGKEYLFSWVSGTNFMPWLFGRDRKSCHDVLANHGKLKPSQILLDFDTSDHPVVMSLREWVRGGTKTASLDTARWLQSSGLVLYPALEEALKTASSHLLNHYGLQTLPFPEQQRHLTSVGFALLRILAAQVDLEEPLNLNGNFLEELKKCRIASRVLDYEATLATMWQSCTTASTCDVLQTQKAHLLFQRKHIDYDVSNQPPAFYCLLPAQSPATPWPPTPVVVKRHAETEHPDAPPPQRSQPTPRLKRKSAFKSAGKETSEDKSVDAEDNEVESEEEFVPHPRSKRAAAPVEHRVQPQRERKKVTAQK
ncbi:hypothetical protein GGX14DRAFT_396674 [Mycena pura]|uniref:GCM domain-containing protein n=1 Tax=Mycena pura TaxID=153505 RepID=A0AAD6VHL3_9AGAR|nr:hypothetical protein GGX14DRAFT_396674 [Mycena pura]